MCTGSRCAHTFLSADDGRRTMATPSKLAHDETGKEEGDYLHGGKKGRRTSRKGGLKERRKEK